MANKTIAFTAAGNGWRWVGNYWQENQVGQVVTVPEHGKITALKFKVAGLGPYYDPVYHEQYDHTHVAAAVWDARTGDILTKSSPVDLGPENGGASTWKTFNVGDLWVAAGQVIIVGFWRIKTTTQYATQWDYCTTSAADAETFVQHDIGGTSATGPVTFVTSSSTPGKSLNYEIDYVAGGHAKVWDAGAWRDATARVWDGSAWIEGDIKVYDGAAWNESI